MKGGGLGEAGPIVREIRIESILNVLKSAQEKNADFVLLCGDIFEHNMVSQETVKKVVAIFNQYPRIPIYLLPGNHDILGSDCVYNRAIFQRLKHLTIITTDDVVEVVGATLHPCPVLSKVTAQDLTARIPNVRETDGIHIGVAHGSLVGKFPSSNWEDTALPVDPSCIERTGIDYLALGHWHSHRAFDDDRGVPRIAYSGTHEQTKFGEDDAGKCLLVEIEKKGDPPKIDTITTGKLTWTSDEFEMKDSSSLDELKRHFEAIRDIDMVRLELHGELPLELKEELENMLEFQATIHKNLRVKSESLNITVPPELETPFDFGDPILNQTETYLKESLSKETDPGQRRIIVEALAHLQRYGREVGS
ncbi:MAG: DNA repair exonuclease [Candidatus Aenigmarchaeota archaeon]|nr:DNA repair exonuclease [Candidatus Aenigmarchaeota archaeon]